MSEEKKRKPIKLIDDPSELPTDLSDEEQLEFWETHGLSEEFLDKTEEVPAEERPRRPGKAAPISVRFDAHTLERLKALADHRGIGYQTLLKQFVGERLYEEEKREGLVPADNAAALEAAWQATFRDAARTGLEMARGASSGTALPDSDILAELHDEFFDFWRAFERRGLGWSGNPQLDTLFPVQDIGIHRSPRNFEEISKAADQAWRRVWEKRSGPGERPRKGNS
jgi:hypothetical protein